MTDHSAENGTLLEPEAAESFAEFWERIVAPNGHWDHDQVKRELHDYQIVMSEASKVYYEITDGRISKPNTAAEAVIGVHETLWRHGDDLECPACDGSGDYEEVEEGGTCPLCAGTGELTPGRLKSLAFQIALRDHSVSEEGGQ